MNQTFTIQNHGPTGAPLGDPYELTVVGLGFDDGWVYIQTTKGPHVSRIEDLIDPSWRTKNALEIFSQLNTKEMSEEEARIQRAIDNAIDYGVREKNMKLREDFSGRLK